MQENLSERRPVSWLAVPVINKYFLRNEEAMEEVYHSPFIVSSLLSAAKAATVFFHVVLPPFIPHLLPLPCLLTSIALGAV